MTKDEIRKKQKELRNGLSRKEWEYLGDAMSNRLFQTQAYQESENIFSFVSFQSEADTKKIILRSLLDGKKVFVPRVEAKWMDFYEIHALDGLIISSYGISEPPAIEKYRYQGIQYHKPEEETIPVETDGHQLEDETVPLEIDVPNLKERTVSLGIDFQNMRKETVSFRLDVQKSKENIVPIIRDKQSTEVKIISIDTNEQKLNGGFENYREEQSRANEYIKYKNLMLLPGLAFDPQGNRIGYGAGYYDRYLSAFPENHFYKIALAFDFQLIDQIETDEYDRKADAILTPTRFLICN